MSVIMLVCHLMYTCLYIMYHTYYSVYNLIRRGVTTVKTKEVNDFFMNLRLAGVTQFYILFVVFRRKQGVHPITLQLLILFSITKTYFWTRIARLTIYIRSEIFIKCNFLTLVTCCVMHQNCTWWIIFSNTIWPVQTRFVFF